MAYQKLKENSLNFLTLFTSFSTLICCALPALMVSLGLGASLVGLLTKFPQLVWLSDNKIALFITGGVLLTLGGLWQYQAKNLPCPIDLKLREACLKGRKWSMRVYFFSLIVYLIGFSFAFIIPKFFN